MKRWLLGIGLALMVVGLVACSEESDSTSDGEKKEVSVMMFEGGFGSEWVKKSAEKYMEENPNITIDVQASPDIHQQLQPRFLSGDAPDLMNPGPKFDIRGLINQGKVQSLQKYMDTKAYNSDQNWGETFSQSQMNLKKDGDVVGIPIVFASGYVWWYDQKLFNDNGWDVPQNWDDLYELNEKAAEKDIAVFAMPGKVPSYYFYGYYLPLVQRIGGTEALENAFNLKEGAFASDAFKKAAEETLNMFDDGLFLDGTLGLSHTEAQTLFFEREALFVTAGTWLEGEMQDVIPQDFKLRALNHPVWSGDNAGKDYAPVSTGWGGGWYVPEGAEHTEEAVDFLKFLSSEKQVENMVENRGLASIVKDTEDAIESEPLKSALKQINKAEGTYAPTAINDLYPELAKNIINEYQSLLLGEITPEEFVQYAEEKATEVRNDDNIKKVQVNW